MFLLQCIAQQRNKERIFNCISFATLLLASFFVLLITYWMVYPYVPVKINKVVLLDTLVKQGDTLKYKVDYCKHTKSDTVISRRFVDGIVYSTPDITASNPKGCDTKLIGIGIPHGLPEGSYYLDISYSYRVNPLKKVSVHFHTDTFEVLGK